MSKLTEFKLIITSFHERILPVPSHRELIIPDHEKIITISGVRRSGKTFYFFQKIKSLLENNISLEQIVYINFEDERLFPMTINDLTDLLDAYNELYPHMIKEKKFFFFDEIQEIEQWQKFVRRLYDQENISLFITGSSSKLLSGEIPTALRGRTLTYKIFPMNFREYLLLKGIELGQNYEFSEQRFLLKKEMSEFIEFGSFPEVIKETYLKTKILSDYYDLVIFRDIIERYQIRNTFALKTILKYLFTNISNLFSLNSFHKIEKNNIKLSINTLSDYISYILSSELIYFVPIYSSSLKTQQVNPVKVYCIDTGLRNAISFKFSKDIGRLVENVVFVELMRREYEIYYWKQKNEVDFLAKKKETLEAFNVCFSDDIIQREVDGLIEIQKNLLVEKVILITKDISKRIDNIQCIPLWVWLLEKNDD